MERLKVISFSYLCFFFAPVSTKNTYYFCKSYFKCHVKTRALNKVKQASCFGFWGLPTLPGWGWLCTEAALSQTAPLKTSVTREAGSACPLGARQAWREMLGGADELMAFLPLDFWHEGSGRLCKRLSFSRKICSLPEQAEWVYD